MPMTNPGFHPNGGIKKTGGRIVPIGPGPLLPSVTDDVKAIVGYVTANGCDGSDRLRTLVVLFQSAINVLIAQDNQVHGTNEPLLPVDGVLAGKTESAIGSYASGMGLKFTSCAALHTGGINPGPQPPLPPAPTGGSAPATGSNTAIYVGVGVVALVGIVALVAASSGKKKRRKR